MVVMEYLDAMTAKQANQLHQLLPKFFADVQEILNQLHENDFVFGDLWRINIMVMENEQVKFIDFDWAGKAGESHYPLILSKEIGWAKGVEGFAVMKKEHNLHMLESLV